MSARLYRPVEPSDLPRIQAGTLKAFFLDGDGEYIPARLISTNLNLSGYSQKEAWIITEKKGDGLVWSNKYIFVDVTPEKRYAIWNHKRQQFHTNSYASRSNAEDWLAETKKGYSEKEQKNFYIVEWEVKDVV